MICATCSTIPDFSETWTEVPQYGKGHRTISIFSGAPTVGGGDLQYGLEEPTPENRIRDRDLFDGKRKLE